MTAVMQDPEFSQFRGTFHSRYALAKERYQRTKKPRLMELNLTTAKPGEDAYFVEAQDDEFCVVDVVTQEKAWFEWLPGLDQLAVKGLIEGHFGDAAFPVAPRMWFV